MSDRLSEKLEALSLFRRLGQVQELSSILAKVRLPRLALGEECLLQGNQKTVSAEVMAIREESALLLPLSDTVGLDTSARAVATGRPPSLGVGESLLGRVLDPCGTPLDGKPVPTGLVLRALWQKPPSPLQRRAVESPLETGLRVIDGFCPLARGQRIGVMAPAGVGKSTLLGRLARDAKVDVTVVALCGERSREIQDFSTREIGTAQGRTVVFAAAADAPPMSRVACALAATTAAEYFRDEGREVMLLVDSLTRVARAQREVGLSLGEPPARRGFPPSVPQLLARLLERGANGENGRLTAIYAVLVEGDDPDDPIAEEARSLLDGHLWLSREIAERGRYPAIHPLKSISRLAERLRTEKERTVVRALRALLALYESRRDLIALGAYEKGREPLLDEAIRRMPRIEAFFQQEAEEYSTWEETSRALLALLQ